VRENYSIPRDGRQVSPVRVFSPPGLLKDQVSYFRFRVFFPATFPPHRLYYNITMVDPRERALALRTQAGDLEAYGDLIKEYQDSVFSVCYRILGNRQEAEDLTQDAFLRAYRQISRFDPQRPFGPWMRVLTANLCYNHLNKARLERVPLEEERERLKDDPNPSPEVLLEVSQENRGLYRALWQLPEGQRLALELRHFQGLSYQEMAEALDLPLNTVRSHLYRGRQRLAELLEEEGK
jgi:RNA polymerase sigma-70 factor (ECF subfamily)